MSNESINQSINLVAVFVSLVAKNADMYKLASAPSSFVNHVTEFGQTRNHAELRDPK